MNNKLVALCALPFVLVIVVSAAGTLFPFTPRLSPQEDQIMHFQPEDIALPSVTNPLLPESVESPIRITRATLPAAEQERAQTFQAPRVSMIVISTRNRFAIIDGILLREGDSNGAMLVTKIEDNRVQVKNYTNEPGAPVREVRHWLYLEEHP